MTALHWSAYNNTPDNVRLLLKAVSGAVFSRLAALCGWLCVCAGR